MALSAAQKADIAASFRLDPAVVAVTIATMFANPPPAGLVTEVEAELDALRAASPRAIGSKEAAAMTAVLVELGSKERLYIAGAGNSPEAIEAWLDADTTGWRRLQVKKAEERPWYLRWKKALIRGGVALAVVVTAWLVFGRASDTTDTTAGTAIPAAKPDPVGSATAALDAAALEEARKGLEGLAPLFDGVRRSQADIWGDTPTARAVAGAPEALAMFRDARRVELDVVQRQVAELTDQVGAALASAKGDRLYDTRQAHGLADGAKVMAETVGGQLRKQQAVLDRIVALSSGATPGTVTASEAVAAAEAAKAAAAAEAAAKAKAQADAEVEAILVRNPKFVGLMATIREGGELQYRGTNVPREVALRFARGDGGYPLWHFLHSGDYQSGGLDLGPLGGEKSLLSFKDYCRVLALQPERFPDATTRARHPGMFQTPTGEMGREISWDEKLEFRFRDMKRTVKPELLNVTWETRP